MVFGTAKAAWQHMICAVILLVGGVALAEPSVNLTAHGTCLTAVSLLLIILRTVSDKNRASEGRLTPQECDECVYRLVDYALSADGALLRKLYLVGLQNPARANAFLKCNGLSTKPVSAPCIKRLHVALQRRDRKTLVAVLRPAFIKDPPPKNFPETLFRLGTKKFWRGAFLGLAGEFKGEPGFERKINPEEYRSLASLGEELAPVIQKLLNELEAGTCRSVQELLQFWSKDKPKECKFLIRNIDRLDSAMRDETLLSRAKKLPARARLIADAMAGAEYDLSLRTSIARAREGRRQKQPGA